MVNIVIRTFNVIIRWSMTDIDRRFRIMAHEIEEYVYIYIIDNSRYKTFSMPTSVLAVDHLTFTLLYSMTNAGLTGAFLVTAML